MIEGSRGQVSLGGLFKAAAFQKYELPENGYPVLFLLGGDDYWTGECLRHLRPQLAARLPGAVEERLEHPVHSFPAAHERYTMFGLWGECRLVEFHGDGDLSKSDQEAFASLADKECGGNVLLVRLSGWKAWMGKLRPEILCVDCSVPKRRPGDTREWLQHQAESRMLQVTRDGLNELVDRLGEQEGVLDNALNLMELNAPGKKWNAEAVSETFGVETEGNVFALADALSAGDMRKSLEVIDRFLSRGTSPDELIGGLRFHFRRLLSLRLHQGWTLAEAKTNIKVYSQSQFSSLRRQASSYRLSELKSLYRELYNLDRLSKMGGSGDRELMESFVFKAFAYHQRS